MSDLTIPPAGQDPVDSGVPAQEPTQQPSEEALRLAAIGRGEEPAPAPTSTSQKPEGVPDKFWDAEKGEVRQDALLKSYLELEKLKGQPTGAAPEPQGEPSGDPAGVPAEPPADPNVDNPVPDVIPAELFASARDEYAQSGDLSEDTRKAIVDKGIPEDVLQTYLEGVKALSSQLEAQVFALAGGEASYKEATGWAQANWEQAKIDQFNAALNNPALRDIAVKGLLAEVQSSSNSEGRQTQPGFSADTSDVYRNKDEFLKDLAAATSTDDPVARRTAVQKLERSKKAGTLAGVTPRPTSRR